MASTYSSLKVELIATGEQAGTWGVTTNTNLGTTIEQAIVGTANVTMTSATNTAITISQNNTFQAARGLRLNLVGSITTSPYLYVPAITKQYIVNNGLANTVIVSNGTNAGATGTSVSIPANRTVMIYNDGTNVAEAISYHANLSVNTMTFAGATANNSVVLGSNTTVATYVSPGTSGNVLTSNGTTWISQAASSGITTGKAIAMAMIFGF